jgi:outer membrane biosynthesis protein TonB
MKLLRRYPLIVLVSVLGIFGCSQKKPVLVAPQQPPPTTAPQPTPTPEPTVTEQPQPTQPPAAPENQTTTDAKNKPKSTKHPVAKKPTKKVVEADKCDKNDVQTSASAGQISPVPTPTDGTHTQTSTEQLLQSAEGNLNSIKRQLSKDEEAMRTQIKEFIIQSHKATSENDLARAHNLAVKARLLSDELIKQR